MHDNVLPLPDEGPPDDPFEAELVAYLDGELDPAAARKVERRLATDPAARAKAAALKKTYDLLDYLPQAEPSATFTTRTLDKIPAVKSGSLPVPIPESAARPDATVSGTPGSTTVSSSVPVPLASAALGIPLANRYPVWVLAAGAMLALFAIGSIGYLGASALRARHSPSVSSRETAADELPLSDYRVIENLALYAAADDMDFVQRLAEPELFGDNPLQLPASRKAPPAPAESDNPSGPAFDARARAFKALPPVRQNEIRELDRELNALDAANRDRFVRTLEDYAVWLDRLPDSERKGVFTAATAGRRLEVIRDIRERQWLNGLPIALRNQLTGVDDARRAEKIQQWKDEEARQRNLWVFVRKNAEAIIGDKVPWPFETEASKKEVIEYVRVAHHLEDPKRCRLNPFELAGYRDALASAEKYGNWAWYGKAIYELARKYEMLPEPGDKRLLYLNGSDLPPTLYKFAERPTVRKKLALHVGKWPDYPLELHDELARGTKFGPKFGPTPPLGPSRYSEFKEPVRIFWHGELLPKLTPSEKAGLQKLEGRWPEYPREFVRLARQHDLAIPGVSLPGSPRKWDTTYGTGPFRISGMRP